MNARRSAHHLRALLIEAGLTVLYRRGLRATASHVPMTEAIEELLRSHGERVGMGSIFGEGRLWRNVGEYQLDLLKGAIEDQRFSGPNDVSLELIHGLADASDQPVEQRIQLLVELCRIAGSMNGYIEPQGTAKGRSWPLWVSIWAVAANDAAARDHLAPALRREEERTISSFVAVYQVMVDKLGLRPRAPYTMTQLATLAASVTDGIALRSVITPETVGAARSPRDDEEWTVLGIGLTAIALEMLESADV